MTDSPYAYCASLTRDQWAWEFLRRNRHYQSDYARFITIWHALETDYGAPPHRDFARWKQDPRAYGPLDSAPSDAPHTAPETLCSDDEDGRVLIECWMGAKWGFHKFPLDPRRPMPPSPAELSWRPSAAPETRPENDTYRLDIAFDLSLPLPPQLEAAKFRLISRTAQLRRAGCPAPLTVPAQAARWTHMLRLLDRLASGEAAPAEHAGMLREALTLVDGGYRDILRLDDTKTQK